MAQALHLSGTALLVPLVAVRAGLMDVRMALASFAHPIIFLFLGGFELAAALQRQGLDQRLAQAGLRLAAGRRWRLNPSLALVNHVARPRGTALTDSGC